MSRINQLEHKVHRIFSNLVVYSFFFFQAEDGIRDLTVTGVQTCALPICGVIVIVVAVSTHCDGMVAGSSAYCVQSGLGTAEPTHTSWVSAFDRPGAPRAAE